MWRIIDDHNLCYRGVNGLIRRQSDIYMLDSETNNCVVA